MGTGINISGCVGWRRWVPPSGVPPQSRLTPGDTGSPPKKFQLLLAPKKFGILTIFAQGAKVPKLAFLGEFWGAKKFSAQCLEPGRKYHHCTGWGEVSPNPPLRDRRPPPSCLCVESWQSRSIGALFGLEAFASGHPNKRSGREGGSDAWLHIVRHRPPPPALSAAPHIAHDT